MKLTIKNDAAVFIEKTYFPQYVVTIDAKEAKVLQGPENALGVTVPEGTHTIEFVFHDTPIRMIANSISIIALIALIMYHFTGRLSKKEVKKNEQ
jgi:uncharacterized membrane protein YfhO